MSRNLSCMHFTNTLMLLVIFYTFYRENRSILKTRISHPHPRLYSWPPQQPPLPNTLTSNSLLQPRPYVLIPPPHHLVDAHLSCLHLAEELRLKRNVPKLAWLSTPSYWDLKRAESLLVGPMMSNWTLKK